MRVKPLSHDHKPSLPMENQRILSQNGRVGPMLNHQGQPVGPARVWMQGQDAPGLAMSRSLGDEIAHTIGVNCCPEVSRFTLGPDDKFLVVASDGVWEYLSNEEVGRIVWPFFLRNSPEQAGKALVKAAADKWR